MSLEFESKVKEFREKLVSDGYTTYLADFLSSQLAQLGNLATALDQMCSDITIGVYIKY